MSIKCQILPQTFYRHSADTILSMIPCNRHYYPNLLDKTSRPDERKQASTQLLCFLNLSYKLVLLSFVWDSKPLGKLFSFEMYLALSCFIALKTVFCSQIFKSLDWLLSFAHEHSLHSLIISVVDAQSVLSKISS